MVKELLWIFLWTKVLIMTHYPEITGSKIENQFICRFIKELAAKKRVMIK